MNPKITQQQIETNGISLNVALAGPADGQPVVLLHGFPEYWGAWQAHMSLLADAGYRVIAPDQRGYGGSSAPAAVKEYAIDTLALDVVGLLDSLGHPTAHIVGHDWGGAVAWQVARCAEDRIDRVVVINCPPIDCVPRTIRRDPLQILQSWYILFFQLPWLPQWVLSWFGQAALRWQMTSSSRPGTFDDGKLDGHQAQWQRPGRLRGMVHWYRCIFRHPSQHRGPVRRPALLLWGDKDRFLRTSLIDLTQDVCDNLEVVRFPDNTHWLPHEEPQRVVAQMRRFFSAASPQEGAMMAQPPPTTE